MSTYVLVHGAWHGAWCWERVAGLLKDAGHAVRTPVLTGLGERVAELAPDNSLSQHIRDVEAAVAGLDDCVLVGHSYAGMLITPVAERVPLQGLVYLDAYMPRDGESTVDVLPPARRIGLQEQLKAGGDGWRMAPPSAAALGVVTADDRAWVDARTTPMALACYLEPVRLAGGPPLAPRKLYVRAADFPNDTFERTFLDLEPRPDWQTVRLPGGHDLMVDSPAALCRVLLGARPFDEPPAGL